MVKGKREERTKLLTNLAIYFNGWKLNQIYHNNLLLGNIIVRNLILFQLPLNHIKQRTPLWVS